jgi:hypothetical protein
MTTSAAKYWFIAYEWWTAGGGHPQISNEVWHGTHPLDRLVERKTSSPDYTYRLIFYHEIDEELYMKYRLTLLVSL